MWLYLMRANASYRFQISRIYSKVVMEGSHQAEALCTETIMKTIMAKTIKKSGALDSQERAFSEIFSD